MADGMCRRSRVRIREKVHVPRSETVRGVMVGAVRSRDSESTKRPPRSPKGAGARGTNHASLSHERVRRRTPR
jgi:hypothetical protein